ncbi:PaaI family thioesterase [Caminibacter pacificus]|uniref:Acyl-CoA thioesterase n=1 Tax=Caminibacter pacificus TaxID=1424653 RepID=A0AAJ4REA4_9BACT|nr:hotdog fold thioesterase [Caminibacter pacificus]NPA87639.1 hotdog fold thioesterase [Campylobacterota bacterium]QCI28323.1 hotdog fold thioesterase [Caminibacter pacificus]ROR40960.1 acyl-CoA thioesterase [Caminibacter pacificus]
MQKIFNFFNKGGDFASNIGIKLLEVHYGYAKAKMQIKEFHLNQAGVAHGGAIFTLADFAFAVASNSFGKVSLAINTSISFMHAAKLGDILIAEANLVDESNRLATYEVIVKTEDKKIAFFTGTVYKTKKDVFE